jgi:allantoin racemase
VLDLETDPNAPKIVTEACRGAVDHDGSDAVVLDCAGMADMCRAIAGEIGIPVVDGVTAATLTVQSLLTMGLSTGKRGEYAPPSPKRYTGMPQR